MSGCWPLNSIADVPSQTSQGWQGFDTIVIVVGLHKSQSMKLGSDSEVFAMILSDICQEHAQNSSSKLIDIVSFIFQLSGPVGKMSLTFNSSRA